MTRNRKSKEAFTPSNSQKSKVDLIQYFLSSFHEKLSNSDDPSKLEYIKVSDSLRHELFDMYFYHQKFWYNHKNTSKSGKIVKKTEQEKVVIDAMKNKILEIIEEKYEELKMYLKKDVDSLNERKKPEMSLNRRESDNSVFSTQHPELHADQRNKEFLANLGKYRDEVIENTFSKKFTTPNPNKELPLISCGSGVKRLFSQLEDTEGDESDSDIDTNNPITYITEILSECSSKEDILEKKIYFEKKKQILQDKLNNIDKFINVLTEAEKTYEERKRQKIDEQLKELSKQSGLSEEILKTLFK